MLFIVKVSRGSERAKSHVVVEGKETENLKDIFSMAMRNLTVTPKVSDSVTLKLIGTAKSVCQLSKPD